jgi:cysteine desulfurase/selenocysteine lyase
MRCERRGFLRTLSGMSVWPLAGAPPAEAARSSAFGKGAQPAGLATIAAWRSHFPALAQEVSGYPLAYLDNAATTLRPRDVIDALVRFYERDNANPSPGLHTLARRAAEAQDAARRRVAQFLNAATSEEVIFTRGTTEAVNLLAATWGVHEVRTGDEIVVTIAEHASNLFPWQRLAAQTGARLKVVDVDDEGRLRLDQLAAMLTTRTRLVTVPHVSNVLGLVNPVAEISALAHRHGAAVFVDAAQSAPHLRLDVQQLGCDFLAFSSHKLLGPMGVGVLWGRAEWLDRLPSYHVGSNMAHGLEIGSATPEPGALRFQAGTPNVAGPVGLAVAMDLLDRIGFEALEAQSAALAARALSRLRAIPGLRVLGPLGPVGRVPVVTFTMAGADVPGIVRAADAAGVAIRGGDLAALPLLRRFGVSAAARASAYFYNTTDELDRLADVLSTIRRSGIR